MKRPPLSGRPHDSALTLLLFFVCSFPARGDKPPAGAAREFFRPVLSEEDYLRLAGRYDQSLLDPSLILANKTPDWGATISKSDPDRPAAQAGLGIGWTIIRCNDREIWHRKQNLDLDKPDCEIVAVSPEGEEKAFRFNSSNLGFSSHNVRRPERVLLREIPRGPWDRDMLIAVQGWAQGDQEMAETAMNHAAAKGMPPSPIADFYAALLALDRGDRAMAKDLCEAVLTALGRNGELPRFYRQGMRSLAVGLNDMELLKKSSAELQQVPEELKQAEIDFWQEHGAGAMKESLLKRAEAGAGEDLTPQVSTPQDGWERMANNDGKTLVHGFAFSAPAGRYSSFAFVPAKPVRNMIWEVRGAYGDKGTEPGDRAFEIAFFDRKIRAEHGARVEWAPQTWRVGYMCTVQSPGTERSLNFSGMPGGGVVETNRRLPRMSQDESAEMDEEYTKRTNVKTIPDQHVFDIKFIRIDNELEIIVNGATYQHLPIPETVGDLGCEMLFSGTIGVIYSSTLKEIR